MELIPPLEIASKIMSLIQDAESEITIVSPYISIEKWYKMKNCIQSAVNKKIQITFYVRADAVHDLSFLLQQYISIVPVKNLHAKVYLNESYGIITSQNMTYSSDVNSIDIGYKTENPKEYDELLNFISKYLNKKSTNKPKLVEAKNINNAKPELDLTSTLFLSFSEKFKDAKFTKAQGYIFSSELLYGADVMISDKYVVKSSKKNIELIGYFNRFKNSSYLKTSSLDIEINSEHPKFIYVTLSSNKKLEPTILANVFIELTGQIKNGLK